MMVHTLFSPIFTAAKDEKYFIKTCLYKSMIFWASHSFEPNLGRSLLQNGLEYKVWYLEKTLDNVFFFFIFWSSGFLRRPKNLKQSSTCFDVYLVNVKSSRRLFQIFVAFSECQNFKDTIFLRKILQNSFDIW